MVNQTDLWKTRPKFFPEIGPGREQNFIGSHRILMDEQKTTFNKISKNVVQLLRYEQICLLFRIWVWSDKSLTIDQEFVQYKYNHPRQFEILSWSRMTLDIVYLIEDLLQRKSKILKMSSIQVK